MRTAYGDSSKTYGGIGNYSLPVMGAGQGNGVGPQMWAVLSAVLFLAMHMEGLSTQFCQKMTAEFISLTGFMYVDDMDLICIHDTTDGNILTEELQLMLSYWNKLVRVTGGALEPSKSGWYCSFCQHWDKTKGTYTFMDTGKFGGIKAVNKDGKKVSLQYVSCHKAQEMLGIKMCPTGNQQEQIDSMLAKSVAEANLIQLANLKETEIRHAVVSSIFPRLNWLVPSFHVYHSR